ncbi:TrmH family RNA methyltransferase [Candidatus Dependentiae bacterium]
MERKQKEQLLAYLLQFVTPNKKEKMEEVIVNRTHHVTPVLEDIYQSHNASAVLRTAECFGVQNVHVVQQRNQFKAKDSVAMGAAKWLHLQAHQSISSCFEQLKKDGYRIIATSPHGKTRSLLELPVDRKFALVFGTEELGLTKTALELADEFVTIPMYGFTESFNISVSVGICLHHIITKLQNLTINWRLTQDELLDLRLTWARAAVRGSDAHERLFFKK